MRTIICLSIVLLLLISKSTNAQSVLVRIPDTTAVNGSIMDLPIYVDSSLTGKNIISYQVKINYNISPLSVIGIITTGTVSSGFSAPIYQVNTLTNAITISAAGSSPLIGKGVLFYIRFQLLQATSVGFYFTGASNCFFNQGNPIMNLTNGSINITSIPTINASFSSNNPLTLGDSVQVYVSGGTAPYSYQVLTPSVANITSNGMLKSSAVGKTKVRVQSANSLVDTTDNEIEIRALKLSLPDTTILPLSIVTYPIKINSTNSSNIISGSFRLNYTSSYLIPDSIITVGTLLQNAFVTYQNFLNYTLVSFASSSPLVGAGDLLKIKFKILNPTGSGLFIQNIVFNQSLLANNKDGYIYFTPISALNISPTFGELFTNQTQQFTASGGKPPYLFSVSDTSRATILSSGLLRAKKGGQVKAEITDSLNTKVQTNFFQLYDAAITLPVSSILSSSYINYPIFISNYSGLRPIYSIQITVSFPTNTLDSVMAEIANSLTSNWSITQNVLSDKIIIAIAGITPINMSGVLFRIKGKVKSTIGVGNAIYFNAANVLINEGDFYAKITNGSLSIVTSLQKDIGINTIPNMNSSCGKSSEETISASIYNYNNYAFFMGDTIMIAYKINNNPIVKDTIILNDNLSFNSTYIYNFKQKANLLLPGLYNLKIFTFLPNDLNRLNDTNSITFQVYDKPIVNLGTDTAICFGASKFLNATNPSSTYLWSNSSTNSTILVNTSGQYWVQVSNSNCTSYDTINIAVNPIPPVLNLSGLGFNGTCGIDSVLLTVPNNISYKYRWLLNGLNTSNSGDTLNQFFAKNSGTFTVKTTNMFGCSSLMKDTIITLATSRQNAPAIAGNTSFCEGGSLILNASTINNVSYRWIGPNGFNANTQNIQILNTNVNASGLYSVYVIKNSPVNGCDTSSIISTFVTVYPKPIIQSLLVSGNLLFCNGDSVILSINNQPGNNYRWLKNAVNTVNSGDTLNTYTALNSGTYTVKVTNASGCFSIMRDTLVTVNPIPNTTAINGNNNVLIGSTNNYNVTNTIGSNYSWTVNNGTINSGNGTNSISVTWGANIGIGSISVIETNISGCLGITKTLNINLSESNLTVNPLNLSFERFASAKNIGVTSNTSWIVSTNQTWVTLNKTIGNNNDSVTISLAANSTFFQRTATVTFTAGNLTQLVNITQSENIPDSLSLNADTIYVLKAGNTNNISVTSNRTWVVSSNQSWATVNTTSGTGNGTFSIIITANSGAKRTAIISVTAGTISKNLIVIQDALLGVNEIENLLSIYPNPTSGLITISSTQTIANIEVFDVTGKLVYNQQNNNHQTNLEINLSALSNGIYFINAQNNFGGISKSKLVISK
ncbi:MAG: T9SS type A sorting domain-containing protein [Bacteroidia bacterium]|nr:T9SS type A sorting domain-containing protein [Bacteroidia bacterium]